MFWIFWFIIRLIARLAGSNAVAHAVRRPEMENALDRAEILLITGKAQAAREALDFVSTAIEKVRGQDGSVLRVRLRTILTEIFASLGRIDISHNLLAEAKTQLEGIRGDPHLPLAARLDAMTALLVPIGEADDDAIAAGTRALECDPLVNEPEVRVRLVLTARRLGQIHHRRGDWIQARARFEQAVAISEKFAPPGSAATDRWDTHARAEFWTNARTWGSASADELARVATSLGDFAEAKEWYARSVTLLDGARLTSGRIARVKAMALRALNEPMAGIEAPSVRAVRFEEALAEAMDTGPAGLGLAAEIEAALANIYSDMGDAKSFKSHLAASIAAGSKAGPGAVSPVVRRRMEMARQLESECDYDEARAEFKDVWNQWSTHADPSVRSMAANAGIEFHRLLPNSELEAGAKLLDAVEAVIPGIPIAERARMRVYLAIARAAQLLRERNDAAVADKMREALSICASIESNGSDLVMHRAEMQFGVFLVALGRRSDADEHFTAALEALPRDAEVVESANALLHRGQNRLELGQTHEATADLRRARDLGSGTGTAPGRLIAAKASLALGDLGLESDADRRECYESAARFGRLSGRKDGLALAEAAENRMKECRE